MNIDLSPERPVSSRDPDLTLAHIFLEAKSARGLEILWAKKDYRLLRTCKMLCRHGIFVKAQGETGVTRFRFNPSHQG